MRDGKSKPCRKSWISEFYPSYSLLITKFKIMINLTSILGPFIEDENRCVYLASAQHSRVQSVNCVDSEIC